MKRRNITLKLILAAVILSLMSAGAIFYIKPSSVNGIAVSVYSATTDPLGKDAFGSIIRYYIRNNVSGEPTTIYSKKDARCVSISPDGKRIAFIREDGKLCIQNINGGELIVLNDMPKDAWIDWPANEFIYYTNAWMGDELWKVNTSGKPSPEKAAGGLNNVGQFSVAKSLDRGTVVVGKLDNQGNIIGATSRTWVLKDGLADFVSNNEGCGAGISPNGKYFSNNQSDHQTVRIRKFNGKKYGKFNADPKAGGDFWNRNRWSSNSNEWLTFTQGIEYQLQGGHHQVLYKMDGSDYIIVQPLEKGKFYEGCDFWMGNIN